MTVQRTPEARFSSLPGFDYDPEYTEIEDDALGTLRIAHVAAGPEGGPVVLLLHGECYALFLVRRRHVAGCAA